MAARDKERLARQLEAFSARVPRIRRAVTALQGRPYIMLRLPLGLLLVAGGMLAILPIFGLWMIPLGLLLLAIDVPLLRPMVSAAVIRLRRRWALLQRNLRKRPF